MKYFLIICCLLGIHPALVSAENVNTSAADQKTANAVEQRREVFAELSLVAADPRSELLRQLSEKKLNKAIPVLEQLAALDGEVFLPLFRTMLAGDLYYVKKTRQLVGVSEQDGEKVYHDVQTQEPVVDLAKRDVKKIRVNNRLRGFLRGVIARIQLSSSDSSVREMAVRNLLGDLDEETIDQIKIARQQEKDASVQQVMDLALAMYTLTFGPTPSERMSAVAVLSGSLEGDVRNVLRLHADMEPDHSRYDAKVTAAAQKALKQIEGKIEFYGFVDQLFFGLSLGSVLLLAAIGLAITFGVMGVINMAHGEMVMLGAYTTYIIQMLMPNAIEYSLLLAVPAAFVVSGLMGVIIERGVIRFLHGRPLETLLATFGISLILQQLVRTVISPQNVPVSTPEWMSGTLDLNPVLSLTLNRLYILAFALLVFFALMMILKKTNLGLNVRAVSQNRAMARAMGVRSDWVDAMTFGLGSGIAGIAGVALSQLTNVGPNLGQSYIIDSFMVVVFGGVGNLWGTLVAAFSLGIANKFLEPATGAVLASILVLVFIILFIQKRPKGLFPQKGRAAE